MEPLPPAPPPPGPVSLLAVLGRHKVLVGAITLTAGVLGYLVSSLQPPVYKSTARVLLKDPRSTTALFEEARQPGQDPSRFVRNRAQSMTSTTVMERAAQLLGDGTPPAQVRAAVTVEPAKEVDLITVSARAGTASRAAAVVNAVGSAYSDVMRADNRRRAEATRSEVLRTSAALRTRVEQLQGAMGTSRSDGQDDSYGAQRSAAVTQLLQLEGKADELVVDAALYGDGVQMFERATPPGAPIAPKPTTAALMAALLGFLAALAFAWWRSEHRQVVDNRQDPAAVLAVPLLGEVPDFAAAGIRGNTPARDLAGSPTSESYHFLVSALGFALHQAGGNTVMITSAAPGDGKTVTAVNLGIAAVQDGRRVLLVDADQRERGLTALAGVAREPGLTDLDDDRVLLPYVTSTTSGGGDLGLPVIAAGRPLADPAGFFRTSAFRRAVQRFKESADLVVLDCPPLSSVSGTSAVAASADGVVLVVKRGTPVRLLREARERLSLVGAPVLGYVFTRAEPGRTAYGYPAPAPAGTLGRLRDRVRAKELV